VSAKCLHHHHSFDCAGTRPAVVGGEWHAKQSELGEGLPALCIAAIAPLQNASALIEGVATLEHALDTFAEHLLLI
jgi:hypothetical protein